MRESYHLAKSLFPKNLISKHWDIYPPRFWEVLFDNEKLKNFRSNELSFKFNDSLEKAMLSRTTRVLNRLKKITGEKFIETNKETFFGNPQTLYIDQKEYDYHDLFIIYFFALERSDPAFLSRSNKSTRRLSAKSKSFADLSKTLSISFFPRFEGRKMSFKRSN